MAIKISQAFKRTAGFPIDETMLLTSAEMLAIDDADMPDVYFALNSDDGKMYIYNKDNEANAETGKFKVLESGGGNATIGKDYTTNITVGGLAENTDITSDMTLASLIEKMTTTVYYPTYVAPSASLSYNAPTLVKVGANIDSMVGTVNYNAGAINLRGTKQANRGGAATLYRFKTTGATTDFDQSNTTGAAFNVSALTRATKGEISIVGTVEYAEGAQPKDSNGDDYQTPLAAGSVNTTAKKVEFILPFYHGASPTLTISDFTGLVEDLSKKGNKTYSYDTNVEHVVIAYDSAYGDLSTIVDQNNFDVTDGFTKSTVIVDGQSYIVYAQNNATKDDGASYTFKF